MFISAEYNKSENNRTDLKFSKISSGHLGVDAPRWLIREFIIYAMITAAVYSDSHEKFNARGFT